MNQAVIVGENSLEKRKNVCSLDQLNTKKIAWPENGKRQVQLNISRIAMGCLTGCTQKHYQIIQHTRTENKGIVRINNLETKAEYDKSIKVFNKDRGNIVNTNSWKPLSRRINMVRHANASK